MAKMLLQIQILKKVGLTFKNLMHNYYMEYRLVYKLYKEGEENGKGNKSVVESLELYSIYRTIKAMG